MIERYSIPEMEAIWSDENRFSRWLEIELLAVEARCGLGAVPRADLDLLRSKARFDPARIAVIENTVKHDVIAFLMSVSESLGPESRHIHYGMTSSDILDTALATQLRDAGALLTGALDAWGGSLAGLVRRTRGIPCMGRTHGMHAEPTTFALKFAGHHAEYRRCRERLESALADVCTGKLSGAVGTYAHLDPSVEEFVCARLGLRPETVATQVVPRDRHAAFLWALASIGGALERFATEIRHLQRTEVSEAEEPFGKGQRGSSAMPHKRNPITCERLCGMARLLRSYLLVGLEDTCLWHERDISHSSAERFVLPDACGVALYSLRKACEVADGLCICEQGAMGHLASAGDGFYSQTVLLAMVDSGADRNAAYASVQAAAARASEAGRSFVEEVCGDPSITAVLPSGSIRAMCSLERHLRHEGDILKRAGLE